MRCATHYNFSRYFRHRCASPASAAIALDEFVVVPDRRLETTTILARDAHRGARPRDLAVATRFERPALPNDA